MRLGPKSMEECKMNIRSQIKTKQQSVQLFQLNLSEIVPVCYVYSLFNESILILNCLTGSVIIHSSDGECE